MQRNSIRLRTSSNHTRNRLDHRNDRSIDSRHDQIRHQGLRTPSYRDWIRFPRILDRGMFRSNWIPLCESVHLVHIHPHRGMRRVGYRILLCSEEIRRGQL